MPTCRFTGYMDSISFIALTANSKGGLDMAMRFNPPPNWPPPPAGWQPDPSWPPEPPGWQLWVDDTPSTPSAAGFPLAADAPTQVGHQIPTAQPYASPQQPYTSPQQPYASPQQPYTSPQQPYASP